MCITPHQGKTQAQKKDFVCLNLTPNIVFKKNQENQSLTHKTEREKQDNINILFMSYVM